MPRIQAKDLENILNDLFKRYGANAETAKEVSSHLVMSNLRGNDSHGVMRGPWYMDKIENKELIADAPITVENETPTTAIVNGHWGFGQMIAKRGMELAITKAAVSNIACVTVKDCNHVGRIGAFTSLAAKKGMIGIGTANLHGTSHVVAPFGGIDRKLPTNPISVACPADGEDFMLDMSSCMVAEGTLKMYLNRNKELPVGWIIDHNGQSSRRAEDFYNEPKGAILPLGGISGFKGFALSLAIDILSGALSGASCSNPNSKRHGNACFFIALKIEAFTTLDDFKKHVKALKEHVKSARTLDGHDEIYFPGEPEKISYEKKIKDGLDIDDVTYNNLCAKAKKFGLAIEQYFK